MGAIFLSYRRADSQEVVGRLYDRLITHFPVKSIFRDLDSLPLGKPFPQVLKDRMAEATIALVVIGPKWISITDSQGRRRIDDPADFVRLEVEQALSRGIPIVPVLVSNAVMPDRNELPQSLQSLVVHNGIQVRPDPDFHRDMDRLIGKLGLPADGLIATGDTLKITLSPRLFPSSVSASSIVHVNVGEQGDIALPCLEEPIRVAGLTKALAARAIAQAYVDAQIYVKNRTNVLVERKPARTSAANPIAAGDMLTITTSPPLFSTDHESSVVQIHVPEEGEVELPFLDKPIRVAGLTEAQATHAIGRGYVEAQILVKSRFNIFVERTSASDA